MLRKLTAVVLVCSVVGAHAATPDLATAARDDATVLGFVDGAPLTPAERDAVERYVAANFARDAKVAIANAGGAAFAATVIAGTDTRKRAIVREMYRVEIEGRPADDAERRIVEAHDPAIAYDANNKFVVTEHTLDMVMATAAWAARVVGAPAPTPALRADARGVLASSFTTFDHPNEEAYAHIERNVAVAMPILNHEAPAAQKATLLRSGNADTGRALLAMTIATLELTAFRATSGGGGGGRDPGLAILHGMTMRQLDQSNWQMRHPECGPMGGNPSSCGAALIYRPIMPPFP